MKAMNIFLSVACFYVATAFDECRNRKDCSESFPFCNKRSNVCVECRKNKDCKGKMKNVCTTNDMGAGMMMNECVQCASNEDCLKRTKRIMNNMRKKGKKLKKSKRKNYCNGDGWCQKDETECDILRFSDFEENEKCVEKYGKKKPLCEFGTCVEHAAMPGRPFTVGTEYRVAESCASDGWLDKGVSLNVLPRNVTQSLNEKIGRYWVTNGGYEHASVASFSRHILQLLSLGAPADLVEQAQQALRDEINHAKLCYGIASVFLGREVGPDRLNITSAMANHGGAADNEDAIIVSVIREGAIAETLSAFKARHAAEMATDPAVVKVMRTIAADEARHAALAWSFLEWVLPTKSDLITTTFSDALANAIVGPVVLAQEDLDMLPFGVLTPAVETKLEITGRAKLIPYALKTMLRDGKVSMAKVISQVELEEL